MALRPRLNDPDAPLVTVVVPNDNGGEHLGACLDSILDQSYDNIEIAFSDNASTDDSWAIALEYQKRFPGTLFLARGRRKFIAEENFTNSWLNTRGKYFVELTPGDAVLHPDFVKTCVDALESNPTACLAMTHCRMRGEDGEEREEPALFSRTCVVPGTALATAYMMGPVNPSAAQVMYRKMFALTAPVGNGAWCARYYGKRVLDFLLYSEYPVAYIRKPLVSRFSRRQPDPFLPTGSLMEIVGPYVLNHQLVERAALSGHDEIPPQLEPSIQRLAHLALRRSLGLVATGNERDAAKYYHLAAALFPEVSGHPAFERLTAYWQADRAARGQLRDKLHHISVDVEVVLAQEPPPGSVELFPPQDR